MGYLSLNLVVNVEGSTSHSKDFQCGVPQGSVPGSIPYLLYASPLGDIVRAHGLAYHFYAHDSRLYCSFKPETRPPVLAIESCLNDIYAWILTNMLKLNKEKNRTPSDYLGAEIKHQCSDSKLRRFGKITDFISQKYNTVFETTR